LLGHFLRVEKRKKKMHGELSIFLKTIFLVFIYIDLKKFILKKSKSFKNMILQREKKLS